MSASLSEVAGNTSQANSISEQASIKATETAAILNQLGESASAIGKVVELIKGIAAQTNLLALNATIEAASAGEAGRGFAVVANEVKALANQSAQATEEIRQQIESIQAITKQSVDATGEITTIIQEVSDISSMIAVAVEEQTATINEIATSVGDVANNSQAVSQSIQDTAQTVGNVSHQVMDSVTAVQQITSNMHQLDQGAKEMAARSDGAASQSREITESVNAMMAEATR
jgi:methyl-accepting chemotaxis protein